MKMLFADEKWRKKLRTVVIKQSRGVLGVIEALN